MNQIYHFSDQLSDNDCIPCSVDSHNGRYSRDHIPTKALLDPPPPENLMPVGMCQECNAGFSKDEEYLAAFLATVISGSTELDPKQFPTAFGILDHSPPLKNRIDQARRVQGTLWGGAEIRWIPEIDRIERVIVKNALGHIVFERGAVPEEPPSYVNILPTQSMSVEQRKWFESPSGLAGWPEVGSRLMLRLLQTGEVGLGGWIELQSGVYRYAVDEVHRVRIVLREYLAAEVGWDE